MSLKLYLDFMSQPSRALYIFLKLNHVPFELCPVNLRKGEHFTEDFKKNYNRFQRVPFVHDGDFKLSESIAIIRYVSREYNIDSHWYPRDSKVQAQIDEYLEWQHLNTRLDCAMYFRKIVLEPVMTGQPPHPDEVQRLEENMVACLHTIETVWLADAPYLVGHQISVADVFAACEVEQPRMTGFDPTENRPVLAAWLSRVRTECGPTYEEAHRILNKVAAKSSMAKL